MNFYDAFKDALDVAQKIDNIDLYRKLLDLSRDALDLQNEIYKLSEENRSLKAELNAMKSTEDLESDLELQPEGYYVRVSERNAGKKIKYCAACWQNIRKLMPYTKTIGRMSQCSNCHNAIQ
jgi:cytochrome c